MEKIVVVKKLRKEWCIVLSDSTSEKVCQTFYDLGVACVNAKLMAYTNDATYKGVST